ncbi:hypothetical protein ACHAXR_011861 [Thalassiosira sp. AJA248-18]
MKSHHLVTLLVLILLCSSLLSVSGSGDGGGTTTVEDKITQLKRMAYSHPEGSPQMIQAWQQILSLDPMNLEAHVLLGWALITKMPHMGERGIQLLEASFNPHQVKPTIDFNFLQTYVIAATIGRYRSQQKEYAAAKHFTKLALELSQRHPNHHNNNNLGGSNSGIISHTEDGDVCLQMQLATMLDYFPDSTIAADAAIADMTKYADRLLAHPGWEINDPAISAMMPGAVADPYIHCELSIFYLSFYYRADVAAVARRHYEMASRGWPALNATADFVRKYDEEEIHPCITRKLRLLVISAVLTEGHSNSETFGGMLSRLDRDIFDVTYVLLAEMENSKIAEFTKTHPADRVHIFSKEAGDVSDGAWTMRMANEIESWEVDIIFYFDLTMSTLARRLGMQRLAPVQVNSNGHPITSGHDRSVVQYFISWAAAELPLEEAQRHYTEELIMVPSDIFYQYYERRTLPGQVSRMDGQPFGHLTRSDFGLPSSSRHKNVYLCMQKPFKFQPEFDELVCGVMAKDPNGWIVLHREISPANQEVFEKRLKRNGCNLSQITFLDQMPHHRLLALHRESTVVLDSYPAGGDTTTREVLEMGKPLVTLPGLLLGGRWSLGYMSNIGLKESTKKALIASSPDEYVKLAVQLASDDAFREMVEADIRKSVKNLFQRDDAVVAWQKIFLDISPYQQCSREKFHRMEKHEL